MQVTQPLCATVSSSGPYLIRGCELLRSWYIRLNAMKLPIFDRSEVQIGTFIGFNLVCKMLPSSVVLWAFAATIFVTKNFKKLRR